MNTKENKLLPGMEAILDLNTSTESKVKISYMMGDYANVVYLDNPNWDPTTVHKKRLTSLEMNVESFSTIVQIREKVGFTSGCFDILHPLHIQYLNKCARNTAELIVLIDSDRLILEHKGKLPVFNEEDRSYMVKALECVTNTHIFDSLEEYQDIIKASISIDDTETDIYVYKRANTFQSSIPKLIEIPGTKTIIIPDVERFASSTEIKNFIKQQK